MFRTKTLIVPVTALLCSFLGAATASAQSTTCYTKESLEGSWAMEYEWWRPPHRDVAALPVLSHCRCLNQNTY